MRTIKIDVLGWDGICCGWVWCRHRSKDCLILPYYAKWNNHEECKFKASQRGNLKVYIRKMYEGIVFGCNQCEHKAKTKSHLNVHMLLQHEVYTIHFTVLL